MPARRGERWRAGAVRSTGRARRAAGSEARRSTPFPLPAPFMVWFHAVSLGEGMAALPVVRHCARLHPGLPILLTTTTLSSFEVIKELLPGGVIYQFAPLDCPDAIESFIGYWKPSLILLMESELWPNLIMSAAEKGIAVALLNARISLKSFNRWSVPLGLPLVSLMLSRLSLVIPLSTIQAVRFQLLHTPLQIIHFAGDLKYAVGDVDAGEKEVNTINDLRHQFSNRPHWMAASIHKGEEEDVDTSRAFEEGGVDQAQYQYQDMFQGRLYF